MKQSLKYLIFILIVAVFASSFVACDKDSTEPDTSSDFSMKATLLSVGEKLEVDVIEAEYASGIYHVITSDSTEIYGKSGEKISRSSLISGEVITITYSGQVMMSYPPQIVAKSITLL